MNILLLYLLILLPSLQLAYSPLSLTQSEQKAYLDWVEANGGYKHPNVEISSGPDPAWTIRGLFATDFMKQGERIITIPPNLLLCRPEFCDLVSALNYELSLEQSSFWWPYLSVMLRSQLDLPYVWSDDERDLFTGLYPGHLLMTAAHDMCDNIDFEDSTNVLALQLVGTRSAGNNDFICLIPVLESLNHAQQGFENTFMEGNDIVGFSVYTTNEVAADQQLFYSYGDDSFSRLFHDYGFFSQYPRLWRFEDSYGNEINFKVFKEGEDFDFDFDPNDVPYQKSIIYVQQEVRNHLDTVLALDPFGYTQKSEAINPKRYLTALEFRKEYINAFQLASDRLDKLVKEEKTDQKNQSLCSKAKCDKEKVYFEWVQANGGYKNPKVEISTGPDPEWTVRGLFALSPLSSGETIFWLPPHLSLCSPTFCDLVEKLIHEISLKDSSFFWPYLSLSEDNDIDLPYVWTDEERNLLSGLYPASLLMNTASEMCDNIDISDSTSARALQLVGTRTAGNTDFVCLIPLFESLNHAPHGYENTVMGGYDKVGFSIHATNEIAADQQLFYFYGDGSFSRLFHDYGFFSQYPRLWRFEDSAGNEIKFKIYKEGEVFGFDFNPDDVPYQNSTSYMQQEVKNHLDNVLATEPVGYSLKSQTINPKRFLTALSFRQEYINAFQMAFDRLDQLVEEGKVDEKNQSLSSDVLCDKEDVCLARVKAG